MPLLLSICSFSGQTGGWLLCCYIMLTAGMQAKHTRSISAKRNLEKRRDYLVIQHGIYSERSRREAGSASPIAVYAFWSLNVCAHSRIPKNAKAKVSDSWIALSVMQHT